MDNRVGMNSAAIRTAGAAPSRRMERIFGRDWKVAWPFVLPMMLIMVTLILYPFINAIALSTTSLNYLTGDTVNVGLRNYQKLFTNSDYLLSMQNTIQFTFWSLAVKFVTGMTIALILNSRIPFRNCCRELCSCPGLSRKS